MLVAAALGTQIFEVFGSSTMHASIRATSMDISISGGATNDGAFAESSLFVPADIFVENAVSWSLANFQQTIDFSLSSWKF